MSHPPDPTSVAQIDALTRESGWIRGLALGLLGDEAMAEDVSQEVFVRALRRPVGVSGPRLRAWLATVTRRLASRARQRERSRVHVEHEAARPERVGQDADERLELHRRLVGSVGQLHEPYRTAIVLRYLEGLAPRDIAQRLSITPAAARKRVSRGLELLRSRLDEEFEGGRRVWSLALWSTFQSAPPPAFVPTGTPNAAPSASQAGSGGANTVLAPGLSAMVFSQKCIVLVVLATGFGSLYFLNRDPSVSAVAVQAQPAHLRSAPTSISGPGPGIPPGATPAEPMAREALTAPRTVDDRGRVRVVDGAGKPVTGARVAWIDPGGRALGVALDEHGEARRSTRSVGAQYYASAPGLGGVQAVGGELEQDLVLVLPGATRLVGQLIEDGKAPERPVRIKVLTRAPTHAVSGSDLAKALEELGVLSGSQVIDTRPDGTFELDDLPAGWRGLLLLPTTHLVLHPDGRYIDPIDDRVVSVAADEPAVLHTLKLPCITGRFVWSDDGSPCEGSVWLMYGGGERSDGSAPDAYTTYTATNAGGFFELGLPVEPAYLRGAPEDRPRGVMHTQIDFGVEARERVAIAVERSHVELEGKSFPYDLGSIEVTPALMVVVRVTGPDGEAVKDAAVVSSAASAHTDADGCATIAVGGSDRLTVLAAGYSLADFPVPPSSAHGKPVELRVEAGHTLAVRITDHETMRADDLSVQFAWDQSPFEGAIVRGTADLDPYPASVHRAFHKGAVRGATHNTILEGAPGSVNIVSRAGEDLLVPGLAPGGSLRVRIINALHQALAEIPVQIPDAPGVHIVEIAPTGAAGGRKDANRDVARLRLRLTDTLGASIPGARFAVKPEGAPFMRTYGGDEDGCLDLGPLVAGTYRITLSAPGYLPIEVESLALASGDHERIFVLEEARPLEVLVLDERGQGLRAQWIEARADEWTERKGAGSSGRTLFEAIPRRPVELTARVGTRIHRTLVEESSERAELVVPPHGNVRIRLSHGPMVSGESRGVRCTIEEADDGPRAGGSSGPLVLEARCEQGDPSPLELPADLAPGSYSLLVELPADGESEAGVPLARRSFIIEPGAEALVDVSM